MTTLALTYRYLLYCRPCFQACDADDICVWCLTRKPGCRSLPQIRTTDRTSLLLMSSDPPRWEPLKPSLI